MAKYQLRRISENAAIPKETPAIKDLPYRGLGRAPPMGWNSCNKIGIYSSAAANLRRVTKAAMDMKNRTLAPTRPGGLDYLKYD